MEETAFADKTTTKKVSFGSFEFELRVLSERELADTQPEAQVIKVDSNALNGKNINLGSAEIVYNPKQAALLKIKQITLSLKSWNLKNDKGELSMINEINVGRMTREVTKFLDDEITAFNKGSDELKKNSIE